MIKRLYLKAYGEVQGVNYRYFAKDAALAFGLTGFVKNLSDGSVELVAEGEEERLAKLLKWSYDGSKAAHVDKIEKRWENPTNEFSDFSVIM